MAPAAAPQQMTPQQQNAMANQLIQQRAVEMFQPGPPSQTVNPAQVNPITFTLRNVGLLRSLLVTVTGTIVNNDGANALTATQLGLANLFTQGKTNGIIFTDLSNNQRVNCPSWYLSWLNSVRHRQPFGSGFALETDTMGGYAENYPVLSAPATIAASGTANFRALFEIPIAYANDDLRGAILMNVINANATLQLFVNNAPFTATGTDSTFAIMKGTANAVISSLTITVYQNYLDNLPKAQNGQLIVPNLDLSTVYELKASTITAIPANTDFGYQYPNYRDILSSIFIYNHDGSADAGRVAGTDVNYFALQSANFTNIMKRFPLDLALPTRQILNCDLPVGGYHYSSRRKPISSLQYGNMNFVLNASTATVNAYWCMGLEMFNQPNVVVNAGSLQT